MCFHMRRVNHLRVGGSSVSSKLAEQVFPDATPRPSYKAIIDRCWRAVLRRAIAPTTTTFQHMHNATDDAAIVRPLNTSHIRRQMPLNPTPLLIAEPKQIPSQIRPLSESENQIT